MKRYTEYAKLFKVMSDETRLNIISLLKTSTLTGKELIDKLKITQPTLSHHMSLLTSVNLVSTVRKWKWVYYSLNNDGLLKVLDFYTQSITDKDTI